ncbi:hypothetical protein D3C81_861560 [compost metagenome]
MDQYPVGGRSQLQADDLAYRHFPVGHVVTRLDRAAARSTQHQRQPLCGGGRLRRLGQQLERRLQRAGTRRRLHLQIGTADQGIEIGRARQSQRRAYHPEAAAGAGDALPSHADANLEQHVGEIVAQPDLLNLADIQTAITQQRALTQAVAVLGTQFDQLPDCARLLLFGEQCEAAKTRHGGRRAVGSVEGDTAEHQGLQRLTLHFDARQAALQTDAASIPEARRGVDQPRVILLDMHVEQHFLAIAGEPIALHAAHADLPVQYRAADIQRAETLGGQEQMQAGGVDIERRRLGADAEFTGRRALLAEAHREEVALHQGLQAGDASQRDGGLDHPELAAAEQQFLGTRVHGQFGHGFGEIPPHVEALQRTDLHAIEYHRRTSRLQATDIAQLQHDPEPGLGGLEILVQTERDGRVRWRTVLAMLGCGEGDAAGSNADQRFGTQLETGQAATETDAAGIPESRVLAYQVRVGLLDVDLHLDRALVVAETIPLHLTDLDLSIEHRAALIERTQPLGLQSDVQARQFVRQRRWLSQRLEIGCPLALDRIDGNIDA